MCITSKYMLILMCVQIVCSIFVRYTPTVEVSEGKLRGLRSLSGQNQYFRIPYSISKRFQPPEPPQKWNGVFDAVLQFDSCAQAIGLFQLGKEDCLSLDIYTPEHTHKDQKLPVLVFFHGGGYFFGAKWQYDPEFLVQKNVIVVVANYRQGVLGFLCLNNVSNLGLKDQVAALKWIQKNIAAFSGDPDNVTIVGQSSGAATSSMHFLSKQSKGLFHKAILMSGVALAPWAFNIDPIPAAFQDAIKIRNVFNEVDIYNTFIKAPLTDLLFACRDTVTIPQSFKYAPCVDANFTDPFFHDAPYNIIKSGDFNKVPMIIGITEFEGIWSYGLNSPTSLQNLDDNFSQRLPSIFSWCSGEDRRNISDKIRSHYFNNQKINSEDSVKGGIDLLSDWIAHASADAFSKLMTEYSDKPVYNYLFSYEGGRNFGKLMSDRGFGLKGASHIDDVFYLFKPGGISLQITDSDKLIIERFSTMLTNFMKFGNPTPTETELLPIHWPAITSNKSQVMRIDQHLSVADTPYHVKGEFYLRLMCEHGLSGYVACDSAMQCNLDN